MTTAARPGRGRYGVRHRVENLLPERIRRLNLKVIDITAREGRARVTLADQAHDEASAITVRLEFPLPQQDGGAYLDREERVVEEAERILAVASDCLKSR